MRIATKKGDQGESGLFNGERRSKADAVFVALGDLDEFNSVLGWCGLECEDFGEFLVRVQDDIYRVMSEVGYQLQCPPGVEALSEKDVEFLDQRLELLEKEMGVLREFVRPGKMEASARLHVARSVCRRAERSLVAYCETLGQEAISLKYLNRLSDVLFAMACVKL